MAAQRERMSSSSTRLRRRISLVIICGVMGLAAYSLPWPGSALFFFALVGGGVLAFVWRRRERASHPTGGGRGDSGEN
jgi:uncharacterized membrane protein YeiB